MYHPRICLPLLLVAVPTSIVVVSGFSHPTTTAIFPDVVLYAARNALLHNKFLLALQRPREFLLTTTTTTNYENRKDVMLSKYFLSTSRVVAEPLDTLTSSTATTSMDVALSTSTSTPTSGISSAWMTTASSSTLSTVDATSLSSATTTSNIVAFDIPEILKTTAIVITSIIFLLAGLTYLTASILIPAGAKQLEIECTQIIPDTWNSYLSKLEPGQTMKDRPDLMFELGLLLNKAKADRLEVLCKHLGQEELWKKFQSKLVDDQKLQDRADLIEQLYKEIGIVYTEKVKSNTPTSMWQEYESKLLPGQSMNDRPDLIDEIATKVNMFNNSNGGQSTATPTTTTESAPTIPTTTTTEPITVEIESFKSSHWEDDNDDDDNKKNA